MIPWYILWYIYQVLLHVLYYINTIVVIQIFLAIWIPLFLAIIFLDLRLQKHTDEKYGSLWLLILETGFALCWLILFASMEATPTAAASERGFGIHVYTGGLSPSTSNRHRCCCCCCCYRVHLTKRPPASLSHAVRRRYSSTCRCYALEWVTGATSQMGKYCWTNWGQFG